MPVDAPPLSFRPEESELVAAPPGEQPGWWAGAPSAVVVDGAVYLAYRLRAPTGQGRGYANVVARSTDGMSFERVAEVRAQRFATESLERPAIAVTPDGTWRLYVSCATPGSKHWRIDVVEAATPHGLSEGSIRTVLPGDDLVGVKDPVVRYRDGRWQMWVCCHPLDVAEAEDRMTTAYTTSADGLSWSPLETVLTGRPGRWDRRGARLTAVIDGGVRPLALYDGRATAAENWEERTGWAVGTLGSNSLVAMGPEPIGSSPNDPGGLRYVSVVDLPNGTRRLYYEITMPGGAHELRTQLA